MNAEPLSQHKWLEKMVGEWSYESEASMGPDAPPMKSSGTESVRSIGGLWVAAEGQGECPGGGPAHTMIMTLGFDPQKERFVGSWIGSMMTKMWVYDGELDAEGKALTLSAEGPDFVVEGKTGQYRDVVEFVSDDHRTLTSYALGDDGNWNKFMTAHYRRTN